MVESALQFAGVSPINKDHDEEKSLTPERHKRHGLCSYKTSLVADLLLSPGTPTPLSSHHTSTFQLSLGVWCPTKVGRKACECGSSRIFDCAHTKAR